MVILLIVVVVVNFGIILFLIMVGFIFLGGLFGKKGGMKIQWDFEECCYYEKNCYKWFCKGVQNVGFNLLVVLGVVGGIVGNLQVFVIDFD